MSFAQFNIHLYKVYLVILLDLFGKLRFEHKLVDFTNLFNAFFLNPEMLVEAEAHEEGCDKAPLMGSIN